MSLHVRQVHRKLQREQHLHLRQIRQRIGSQSSARRRQIRARVLQVIKTDRRNGQTRMDQALLPDVQRAHILHQRFRASGPARLHRTSSVSSSRWVSRRRKLGRP